MDLLSREARAPAAVRQPRRDPPPRPDDDADRDRIVTLTARHDFCWDFDQGIAIAFLRDYGIASIARLLDKTREFEDHGIKRYDDTLIFQEEAVVDGVDSERSRTAIRRLNRIHGHYEIPNDEFQYVLATTIVGPVRWIQRYGWRRPRPGRARRDHPVHHPVRRADGHQGPAHTYDGYLELLTSYERDHFEFDPGEHARHRGDDPDRPSDRAVVSQALVPPGHDRADGRAAARALGMEAQPRWLVAAVDLGLRARARLLRFAPPRSSAYERTHPTYPRATARTRSGRRRCSTTLNEDKERTRA